MPGKELIGASTIPLVLTILSDREHYGYELIKKVKTLSGGKLDWSEAMLYPVLHRLQRDGLIHYRWEVLNEGGRKRKYYAITPMGREALQAKKEDWIDMIQLFVKMWDLQTGLQ